MSDNIPDIERTVVSPTEPTTDGDNPNQMGSRQFDSLKENIREYGFLVPVILNRDYVVADGEHRLEAAQDLGLSEIPAVVVDADDADRRVIRQVMNKLKGDHDIQQDAEEFEKILQTRPQDDLAGLLGQSEKSIDGVLSMLDNSNEADDISSALSDETVDDTSSEGVPSDVSDDSSSSNESLGSPDALDPDTMEFDHECPECGYQW